MFESTFGLSAPPFLLSPDPSFYFETRGHGQALAYLKYGVHQREGFIVVTGDIGTGKTTLVRTVMQRLNPQRIVSAQVVSTQLDTEGLLHAVCIAFAVPLPASAQKPQMLARLEAFFTSLVTRQQRAILVIDEAQHLEPKTIEELRMLSNFQHGNHALLQSFLVGQPELRNTLRLPAMEPFRQRIIASCHLGPMSSDETRGYIRHRLTHVGWKGTPAIDDRSYLAIHAHANGIPRLVNLLTTRVLLACWLAKSPTISEAHVLTAADELSHEI